MADVESTLVKKWMTMIVDEKPLGIFIDGSAALSREIERTRGYLGIRWRSSTQEDLRRFKRTITEYETKRQIAAEKRAAAKEGANVK